MKARIGWVACLLACAAAQGAVTNLYDAVKGAGLSLGLAIAGNYQSGDRAFNGVTEASLVDGRDPDERCMLKKPENGVYPGFTVTVPEGYEAGRRIVLRSVSIYPVTYYYSTLRRMPTEYRVEGIDALGRAFTLMHPAGLAYPALSNDASAAAGTHYDESVTNAVTALRGFRTYRITFLDAPAFHESDQAIGISMMEVQLGVEVLPASAVAYVPESVSDLMRRAGIVFDDACTLATQQNAWDNNIAYRAFDGWTYRPAGLTSDDYRWLGKMAETGGTWVQLACPATVRPGEDMLPAGLRVWCATYNGNETYRAPTAWTLSARDADDPVTLMTTNGLDWTGIPYNTVGQNTLGYMPLPEASRTASCRTYRFQPTASGMYPDGTKALSLNVGFAEVEIFADCVPPRGQLRVTLDTAVDAPDGFSPVPDTLCDAAATVTAPAFVPQDGVYHAVTGWRLETFDETAHVWTGARSGSERRFAFTPDAALRQRLVWETASEGLYAPIAWSTEGRETVTLAPDPVLLEGGRAFYPVGTSVTLTAHPCTDDLEHAAGATNLFRSAFVRWEGDTNGVADVTSATVTVTADCARTFRPAFRRDWLYYTYDFANEGGSGTEGRIKNGVFDLRANRQDASARTLQLPSGQDWLRSGQGELDLDQPIVASDTGARWTLTHLYNGQLSSSHLAPLADFTRVVLPRTAEVLYGSAFRDQTNLVEVVLDCPKLVTLTGPWFTRDSALRRVVFKAPRVKCVPQDYLFYKAPLDETDASSWELDGLESLTGTSSFDANECGVGHGFAGTLVLPCVTNLGVNSFWRQTCVTGCVLGSRTAALRAIGTGCFRENTSLASLTLGSTASLTVGGDAFASCGALRTITFLAAVPPQNALDRILAARSAADRATLYVSRHRLDTAWSGFCQALDASLDAAAPADAVGVYVTAANARKAWIVLRAAPFDPKGTLITVR